MKKLLLLFFIAFGLSVAAQAQTKTERKTKKERTSTIPQKVHNVIHPKHKKYNGYKSKHKVSH